MPSKLRRPGLANSPTNGKKKETKTLRRYAFSTKDRELRRTEDDECRDARQIGGRFRNLRDTVTHRNQEIRIATGLFAVECIGVKQEAADRTIGNVKTA